jgi:hypothetical protein
MTDEEKAALVNEKVKSLIERFGIPAGSAADKLRREGPGAGMSDFEDAPAKPRSWMNQVEDRTKR